MTRRIHMPLRVAAVAAAVTLTGLSLAPAAVAAGGDVQVVNTETVQVYTDATGAVQTKRVYEQVAMTGSGTVDLANPIETDGLRNLDGFGGFDVEDGNQVANIAVDGEKRLRTVSNYDGDLPLEVSVQYFLDDERVEPGDLVGASGKLGVQYTVKNVTSSPQEVTYTDGSGGEVTKTVDVPIPMVGSLTTVAPSNFTDVQSDQANIAGDGKGGTKLSFTMTLFPPLGSDTAEFGYTAHIVDGVVPRADISALPVNPLASPTFKTAADSYQGGATTGETLADGATQIDSNLLKLRDGAGDLLAGLIQLRDGSSQLQAGLSGEAAPGAAKLADGAGQLDSGLGQINSGARRLADGTGEAFAGSRDLADGAKRLKGGLGDLDKGAGDLDAGANQLADGQKALAGGLKTLYDGVDLLPESVKEKLKADTSYNALLGALQAIADGVGKPTDVTSPVTGQPATLLGGLNAIKYGLRHPNGYDPVNCLTTKTACGAMDGVQTIAVNLKAATAAGGDLDQLIGAAQQAYSLAGCPALSAGLPPYPAFLGTPACTYGGLVIYGLNAPVGTSLPLVNKSFPLGGVKQQSQTASGALEDIYTKVDAGIVSLAIPKLASGLSNPAAGNCLTAKATATTADDCGIKEAATFIQTTGIPMLVDGIANNISTELMAGIGQPTAGCDPEETLRCAAAALAAGGGDLTAGVAKLVDGVNQLNDGGAKLAAGSGDLSDGLGRIDDGAGQLADGTGEAKDGSGRLADGAGQLADGLKDAADGSSRLTDGLATAADGAPKLVDGAERLSDEGTKKLVEAGEDTAQNYGELYATIEAGSERAQTENMAYGAPEGAMGLTAYSFVINGENGEGGRNLTRGVAGLAILGAGAGAFALRRRLI
ncbi:hypothetical protein [Nocardioides iriomotensis]|uniref:Gram-positive cocci surface proteins LPxTG domain-containing protein n=1 Tax=Nocardioides iriomotensis TaxID=715784 RepID=A0A4Q5J2L4_9ACTN|nr:hypothetical protein [Nocardioides iriomotensis]RYU11908.1 hypothetical protein ETU37_11660 [Nocardioides iriomotensis]